MKRRRFYILLIALAVALWTTARDVRADVDLPPLLLAQLMMKVVSYDHHHAARQTARPRVLVYEKSSDQRSANMASMVAQALRSPDVGRGAPIEVVTFTSASDVATAVTARSASVIVLTSGLEDSAPAIAGALSGNDVITLGTTAALAERGCVAGFELREGKPKLVVNLASARAQNVAFKAELLALARVLR